MELVAQYMPCLYAFIACLGFCILFNIHGVGMAICSFGGALGWLVYLLAGLPTRSNEIAQALIASLAIAAYSEIMARIRKCPVTPYVLIAILPLVPGAGIYYTMDHAINGETTLFITTFMHTLGLAGAMALGILLVGSAVRLIGARRRPKRGWQHRKGA